MVKAQLKYIMHYLQNNEWSLSKGQLGLQEIFIASKLFDTQKAILLIPTSNQFADFHLRLNDVVHTLSQIENISERAMVEKINLIDELSPDFHLHDLLTSKHVEIAAH